MRRSKVAEAQRRRVVWFTAQGTASRDGAQHPALRPRRSVVLGRAKAAISRVWPRQMRQVRWGLCQDQPEPLRVCGGACPYSKLDPAVLVMEATESRNRYNPTEPPDRAMDWSILAQRQMSASLIIV